MRAQLHMPSMGITGQKGACAALRIADIAHIAALDRQLHAALNPSLCAPEVLLPCMHPHDMHTAMHAPGL